MNFAIRIIQPPGDPHWQTFMESAKGFEYSLNALGHTCVLDLERKLDLNARRLIIFNAHRLGAEIKIPYDAILFNAEQIQLDGSGTTTAAYLKHLREHIVWDYSSVNIDRLNTLGVRAIHCPIGYWPGLASIVPVQEDIDILFVGSMNERRADVLNALIKQGLNVQTRFGLYGAERDALVARAKVVLNVHYYPNPIWEIFRCSLMLANKKCVVTESGGVDRDLEGFAKAACVYAESVGLVAKCVDSLHTYKDLGQRGFDVFSKQEQVKFVAEALKRS